MENSPPHLHFQVYIANISFRCVFGLPVYWEVEFVTTLGEDLFFWSSPEFGQKKTLQFYVKTLF